MTKQDLNDTQFWDEKLNTAYPWYTKPCLEYLETLDFSEKAVLEFGSGYSTKWWSKKAAFVVSIEANREWLEKTREELRLATNTTTILREVNEGDNSQVEYYTNVDEFKVDWDVVVVDGILRNECLLKGIELLSKNGGILIADNWVQDYVWLSPAAEEIMKGYERKVFIQPDHKNHEGNPWKTAVFEIPKRQKNT